jgi:hypothetical protein
MKRFGIITFILVLLLCTSSYATKVNSIEASKIRTEGEKIFVPIELKNDHSMMALDLPLKFSEGVTLEEVVFEGTRSENFDFRFAAIDNENNTVVIGLIPMVYGEKPELTPGTGAIANLVFTVDDPTVDMIDVVPTSMESPSHTLMFVYNDPSTGELTYMTPDFDGVSFSPTPPEANVPKVFDLKQNRPNPFNPSTVILYDLPAPATVNLEIYNVLGQAVKSFSDFKEAGTHSFEWNGHDNSGVQVASGVYFYRLEAGKEVATKKMMMLK